MFRTTVPSTATCARQLPLAYVRSMLGTCALGVCLLDAGVPRAQAGAQQPACTPAAASLASPATLPEIVAYACVHSPDLVVARLRVDSSAAERTIAREYANPVFGATPGNPSQYSVALPVDVGPPRMLRTRAAREGMRATALDSVDALRQVLFNTRAAYYDLLLANALAALARQQRDIFRDLLTADSVRLRSGDIPVQDVSRSELELARADARRARAEAGVRAARIALQTIIGVTRPDTAFRVSGELRYRELPVGIDSVLTLARRSRPDLLAASERVRQSQTLDALATAQLLPVPQVSTVYQPAQPFASGKHFAIGVGLQLPVWNWATGERQRARAGVAIAEESRRRTDAQITSDVIAAVDAFEAARAFARSYEDGLLVKSTDNLNATRYAYASGAASLVDLLSAVSSYIDVNTEYLTATHDYWVSAFALDRAAGVDLIPAS